MSIKSQIDVGLSICIGALILAEFWQEWGWLTLIFVAGWALLARGLWRKEFGQDV